MSGQLPQVPNYLPNIQSPFTAAVQGLQLGQAFGEAATAQQQRESLQSAAAAFQRAPSAQTLTPLLMAVPPQTAEALRKHWEGMESNQRESTIALGGQAMSAILAGRTDLAAGLFEQRATAAENAGNAAEAKFYRDAAQIAQTNPQFALATSAVMMGGSEAGKRMLDGIFGATREPVTARRAEAETRTAEATAGAAPMRAGGEAALAVERARNEASPGLPEPATVRVNAAFEASDAARVRAGQLEELRAKFDEQRSLGQIGRGGRAIVEAFGGDTEYGRLVREFTRLRNSEIVRALPPGPATDRDIELISRGFPGENASADSITAFLSAASRMAAYEADYNRFKAMFMDANRGSMGRANRSFEIDGVTIPAGTDMSSAFRRVITPRIEQQRNTQVLQDDPILRRFVQPPAAQ